jgi:pilus assembly protein CpaB
MRRPGTILLLAIFIGALAAAVVYRNLRQQRAEIEAAKRRNLGATVDVVVANDSIPIGSKIAANQVRTVSWPADVQPEGVITDPQRVVGAIARTSIEKNQPIVQTVLMSEGAGLLPLLITEGMRAMSVKVDSVTGVSGFITPNSRVDVLIAGTSGGESEERSKLVLQNVKVLATGKSIEQVDEKPVEVPTVTLLVSPEDGERLTLAARHEPLRLALRNYRDENHVETPGVSTSALFEGGRPAKVTPVRVERERRRAAPRYTVDVFLGEKLTQQALF